MNEDYTLEGDGAVEAEREGQRNGPESGRQGGKDTPESFASKGASKQSVRPEFSHPLPNRHVLPVAAFCNFNFDFNLC